MWMKKGKERWRVGCSIQGDEAAECWRLMVFVICSFIAFYRASDGKLDVAEKGEDVRKKKEKRKKERERESVCVCVCVCACVCA